VAGLIGEMHSPEVEYLEQSSWPPWKHESVSVAAYHISSRNITTRAHKVVLPFVETFEIKFPHAVYNSSFILTCLSVNIMISLIYYTNPRPNPKGIIPIPHMHYPILSLSTYIYRLRSNPSSAAPEPSSSSSPENLPPHISQRPVHISLILSSYS